jgi:hypothetical protein
MVPNFNDIDEETASGMLTTGSELLRMLRDGDPNSTDETAVKFYAGLVTRDSD